MNMSSGGREVTTETGEIGEIEEEETVGVEEETKVGTKRDSTMVGLEETVKVEMDK